MVHKFEECGTGEFEEKDLMWVSTLRLCEAHGMVISSPVEEEEGPTIQVDKEAGALMVVVGRGCGEHFDKRTNLNIMRSPGRRKAVSWQITRRA